MHIYDGFKRHLLPCFHQNVCRHLTAFLRDLSQIPPVRRWHQGQIPLPVGLLSLFIWHAFSAFFSPPPTLSLTIYTVLPTYLYFFVFYYPSLPSEKFSTFGVTSCPPVPLIQIRVKTFVYREEGMRKRDSRRCAKCQGE